MITDDVDLIAAWKFVRSEKPVRPERLCTYIVRIGGIKDTTGCIKQLIGSTKSRPGLINNRSGYFYDEMTNVCKEVGYIRVDNPIPSDLLDAISDDLTTSGVYKECDLDLWAAFCEYQMYVHELSETGLLELASLAQVIRAVSNMNEGAMADAG